MPVVGLAGEEGFAVPAAQYAPYGNVALDEYPVAAEPQTPFTDVGPLTHDALQISYT